MEKVDIGKGLDAARAADLVLTPDTVMPTKSSYNLAQNAETCKKRHSAPNIANGRCFSPMSLGISSNIFANWRSSASVSMVGIL